MFLQIVGDWPSTVKLGECEIKFLPGAVDKCTMVAFTLVYVNKNEDKVATSVIFVVMMLIWICYERHVNFTAMRFSLPLFGFIIC